MAHDIRLKFESDVYQELQQLATQQGQSAADFLTGVAVGMAYRSLVHRFWQTNRGKVKRILGRTASGRELLAALEKGQLQP